MSARTSKKRLPQIRLGGVAPRLKNQPIAKHLWSWQIHAMQNVADAVTLLAINGVLTTAETTRARGRLCKAIYSRCDP